MEHSPISNFVTALRKITLRKTWFPIMIFFIHVICSRLIRVYDMFPSLDIPMHIAGGFAIAYFFSGSLSILEEHKLIYPLEHLLKMILVFSLTCTAAVFWEFLEYVSDRWIKTHAQPGLEDTLLDLIMGIAGGALYIVVKRIQFIERRKGNE